MNRKQTFNFSTKIRSYFEKNLHANIKTIYYLIFENICNDIYCTVVPC